MEEQYAEMQKEELYAEKPLHWSNTVIMECEISYILWGGSVFDVCQCDVSVRVCECVCVPAVSDVSVVCQLCASVRQLCVCVVCHVSDSVLCEWRFYYEVQVRGKTYWILGVMRENVNRKEWITRTPQTGFWTVWLRNENQYEACAGPDVPLTLREKVEVVGVFVDYEEGLVSFYDVKSRSHIYSFTVFVCCVCFVCVTLFVCLFECECVRCVCVRVCIWLCECVFLSVWNVCVLSLLFVSVYEFVCVLVCVLCVRACVYLVVLTVCVVCMCFERLYEHLLVIVMLHVCSVTEIIILLNESTAIREYCCYEGRRSRGGGRVRRQREKRKGKSVGLRIGTLNVGTMTGKGRELADMMERRKVDILCVQETRWKGSKARSIGAGFKLFYYGVDSKRNGVGVVLKEEFVRNVLEVKRVSDRVMSLKLEIEGVMLNVVSGYAPQVGCELEEKERFWSELDEVMESIPKGERVVIGADLNGHVGEGENR
ncbi:hypothetical protein QTP86_001540 [Hemibagrus guttatus]|nr:hypothetical protein QTP86_001540 [Hemibagrus guttatus]